MKVYQRLGLNGFGLCVSPRSLLRKMDEFGINHDSVVVQWKHDLEYSKKSEMMLDEISNAVQAYTCTYCTVDGREVNLISTLSTSLQESSQDTDVNSSQDSLYSSQDAQLIDEMMQDIKWCPELNLTPGSPFPQTTILGVSINHVHTYVQERLGSLSNESVYEDIMKKLVHEYVKHDDPCPANVHAEIFTDIIDKLKEEIKCADFQITGDNLDFYVKVKHMASDRQNKSIHWFNLNAVQNKVSGYNLPNETPQRPIMETTPEEYLPSQAENMDLLHDLIPQVARILVENLPGLSTFKDCIVYHIPHQYSDSMKKKSKQVPLGLFFKNENIHGEMVEIVEELQNKYLPVVNIYNEDNIEIVSEPERLFFGGDQLTEERFRNAQASRSDGDTWEERLAGFIPKNEDWHAIRTLYQVLYDTFFNKSSDGDIGTMAANMSSINCTNAKTDNVEDNYDACKKYVNLETDAMVVAAAIEYFGLSSLEDSSEVFVPPGVKESSKENRRLWLHKHCKYLIEKFVMNSENVCFDEIRKAVIAQDNNRKQIIHPCRICGKEYRYPQARINHEKTVHNYINRDLPANTSANLSKTENDYKYNYTCARLSFGLLLRNFDDAVKEGDGKRIIRCWKFAMLIYRVKNHTKYALAALLLQANIKALLTEREAHSLIWNRTVNNKGGSGKNISLDLRVEHINRLLKEMLHNLGANLSQSAARRCSQSVGFMERFLEDLDKDIAVKRPGGKHVCTKSEHDFATLVEQFMKGNAFRFEKGKSYVSFPSFNRNILHKLNYTQLHSWIVKWRQNLCTMEK